MEEELQYSHPEAPANPLQVITLFDADKNSLDSFVDYLVNTVESGMDDPLKVLALAKKMEYVTKRVTERIKDNVKRAADQYGDKPFMFLGTEMKYEAVHTKYEFKDCNDPQWNEASKIVEEREAFLKALKAPQTIVVESTGEAVTVSPARKVQTYGIKTTVK